jgi:hypothetical protein
MSTKPAVRSSSARVVPNGYGALPFCGTENAFYERHVVWHTAGTPDFHARSGSCRFRLIRSRLTS